MFSIRIETIDHNYITLKDIESYSINEGQLKLEIVFDLEDINTYHIWWQVDN